LTQVVKISQVCQYFGPAVAIGDRRRMRVPARRGGRGHAELWADLPGHPERHGVQPARSSCALSPFRPPCAPSPASSRTKWRRRRAQAACAPPWGAGGSPRTCDAPCPHWSALGVCPHGDHGALRGGSGAARGRPASVRVPDAAPLA